MLDYRLHFAQLVAEDQLRVAAERRRSKDARNGQRRVFRLIAPRTAAREQGRR